MRVCGTNVKRSGTDEMMIEATCIMIYVVFASWLKCGHCIVLQLLHTVHALQASHIAQWRLRIG